MLLAFHTYTYITDRCTEYIVMEVFVRLRHVIWKDTH